ncbi:hypothetical protein ACIBHX_01455 [Nonomuraea sp. NPDC050536]|uniref:hypothetical protein n=1 Tax=Nonomuraea sp. NPDC050536 TaxID=3364366 RepID=UPI0037CB0FBA
MRLRLMPAVAALAFALAACGSQAAGNGRPTASASADAREAAGLKFAQCMREHGVDMQDPKPGEGIRILSRKGDEQKVQKAQEACKQYMKDAVGEKGKGIDPKQQDKMMKFARCMREHGIDMPDPSADGRVEINIPPGTPESKVKQVQQACKEFAPGGLLS